MPGRDHSPENGFTLVELLLAVTFLALVTGPLMSLFAGGYAAVVTAGWESVAVNLCREKIETIKAGGYEYCCFLIEESGPGVAIVENPVPDFALYRRETVLIEEELSGFEGITLFRIKVTVSWRQGENEHTVVLETYLSGAT